MHRLQRGAHPLHLSLGVCLLATTASADFGGWTKGLNGTSVPIGEAVLIAGVVLSAFSALVLLIALSPLAGRCLLQPCCGELGFPVAHGVLTALWLPVIGMAAYLVSLHHHPSIAFLAAGAVFAATHATMFSCQLCGCCCGGALAGGWGVGASDHPKSALLTAQGGGGGGGGGPRDGGAGGGGGGSAACGGNPTSSSTNDVEAGRNPFRATYGLLPGSSSVFAYQIFIPGNEEEQANATSYTGLQSGPAPTPKGGARREGKGRHGPVVHQPLQALQTSMQGPLIPPPQQQAGSSVYDTRS